MQLYIISNTYITELWDSLDSRLRSELQATKVLKPRLMSVNTELPDLVKTVSRKYHCFTRDHFQIWNPVSSQNPQKGVQHIWENLLKIYQHLVKICLLYLNLSVAWSGSLTYLPKMKILDKEILLFEGFSFGIIKKTLSDC